MAHPERTRVFARMSARIWARITPVALVSLIFAGIVVLTPLFGQSLADLARQERAKKAQEKKPVKTFTNDDIPSTPSITTSAPKKEEKEGASAEGKDATATAEGKPGEDKTAEGGDKALADGKAPAGAKGDANAPADAKSKEPEKPKEDPAAEMAKLEKEYREKFKQLRDNLAYEQQKLDVMQRELNLMQTQYYSDPNVAMREQTFRGQINQRTQDIEKQKGAVDKAQKVISDLEEELRKKGLPAGWSR